MNTKIIGGVSVVALALLLSGCSKPAANQPKPSEEQGAQESAQEKQVLTPAESLEVPAILKENQTVQTKETVVGSAPTTTQDATVEIIVSPGKLQPDVVTVKQGMKVKLILKTYDEDQSFSLPAFSVSESLTKSAAKEVEFTADKTGKFDFTCGAVCEQVGLKGTFNVIP